MKRSLNEIEQTCRKAARGSGLPWGVADETGRAIRWLQAFQLDGVSSLAALLESVDHHRPVDYAPESLDGVWHGPNNVLGPIMTGLALSDCMGLMQGRSIETGEIAWPVLVTGFVGHTLLNREQSVTISWLSIGLSICRDRLTIIGDMGDLYTDRAGRLTCEKLPYGGDSGVGRAPGVGDTRVDAQAWEKLENRAHLTYVKATEASRLSGAGAGLNDND